jgi:hypothetical protein
VAVVCRSEGIVNSLFQCTIKVRHGAHSTMPKNWLGAYVDCYIASRDHLDAIRLASEKLGELGCVFEDVLDRKVLQMDPLKWDEHVMSIPLELRAHFPSQAMILRLVEDGGIFFGPFCGWEREPARSTTATPP